MADTISSTADEVRELLHFHAYGESAGAGWQLTDCHYENPKTGYKGYLLVKPAPVGSSEPDQYILWHRGTEAPVDAGLVGMLKDLQNDVQLMLGRTVAQRGSAHLMSELAHGYVEEQQAATGRPYTFTQAGHSLGASLALFAADYDIRHRGTPPDRVLPIDGIGMTEWLKRVGCEGKALSQLQALTQEVLLYPPNFVDSFGTHFDLKNAFYIPIERQVYAERVARRVDPLLAYIVHSNVEHNALGILGNWGMDAPLLSYEAMREKAQQDGALALTAEGELQYDPISAYLGYLQALEHDPNRKVRIEQLWTEAGRRIVEGHGQFCMDAVWDVFREVADINPLLKFRYTLVTALASSGVDAEFPWCDTPFSPATHLRQVSSAVGNAVTEAAHRVKGRLAELGSPQYIRVSG